jgi:hypothetical protein
MSIRNAPNRYKNDSSYFMGDRSVRKKQFDESFDDPPDDVHHPLLR